MDSTLTQYLADLDRRLDRIMAAVPLGEPGRIAANRAHLFVFVILCQKKSNCSPHWFERRAGGGCVEVSTYAVSVDCTKAEDIAYDFR